MARIRLALIFGGRSGEHDVSVVSARSVFHALDQERYEIVPMAIDRHGRWAEAEVAAAVLAESGDRADQVVDFTGSTRIDGRLLNGEIEIAMPILHGPYGEDGTIQGLFEMLGLPYTGCNAAASAVSMSKILSKRLLAQAGLPTAEWHELDRQTWENDPETARSHCLELGLPLFVKPACLGSSVGISKVTSTDQLDPAIAEALRWDDQLVVERGLDAREIEVAVLGNLEPRASVPGEVVPGHEFYDYEDKYIDSSCQLLAPAPLDTSQQQAAQQLAIKIYRCLGCDGMARVDLLLEKRSGSFFWANEANTIPGFTAISMYPRLWQLSGLPYSELLDELVRLALARHQRTAARAAALTNR
jgi:D-alanine-D-alanine ligase